MLSILKEHAVAIIFFIACVIFAYYTEALGNEIDRLKSELNIMAHDAEVRLQILEVKTGARKITDPWEDTEE